MPRKHFECTLDYCGEPHLAKGYCSRHYTQVVTKGRQPTPRTSRRRSPSERDEFGRKYCSRCRQWLSIDQFNKFCRSSDGLERQCRECKKIHHPWRRRHRISEAEYDARFALQGGVCVCGAGDLVIDHDHSCCNKDHTCGRCFRGLLCRLCNQALGLAADDANRLRRLADYLDDWKSRRDKADSNEGLER